MVNSKDEVVQVSFYEKDNTNDYQYAVIISRYDNKWIFCRHRDRDTLECPGGHHEEGETIEETARRELYEETGAVRYDLKELCAYSVQRSQKKTEEPMEGKPKETFGMLYYANVKALGPLPGFEIKEIVLCDTLPDNWTYPLIQPHLLNKALEMGME